MSKTAKKPTRARNRKGAGPERALVEASPAPVPPGPEKPKESVARCPPPDKEDNSVPQLKHLGGSKSDDWNLLLCNQVLNAAWYHRSGTPEEKADQHTAILGFLAGVNPKDA